MNISEQLQRLERDYINLANERLGAKAIYSTDEFFGAMQRMLNPAEPVFLPDEFDDHGKWMDGWETRRRRGGGHDECIARLGVPGLIRAVNIDTRHFTGNYPPQASLEACYSEQAPDQGARWTEIIPVSPLQGDSHNLFDVKNAQIWNHLRLKIYPDGGVARLRVYGYAYRDWSKVSGSQLLDLAAVENGGRAVLCNDEHFGAMGNIIMPGKGINMGDGWETHAGASRATTGWCCNWATSRSSTASAWTPPSSKATTRTESAWTPPACPPPLRRTRRRKTSPPSAS